MQKKNSGIPLWFRLLSVFFFLGSSGAWILARIRPPREYAGLAYESVILLLLAVMLVTGSSAVLFIFFHQQRLARALYYILVKGRWFALWLATYGLLEYYLRLPLLYVEKPELVFNQAVLFSIRGIMPFSLAIMLFVALFLARPIENPFPTHWQGWIQEKREMFRRKAAPISGKWLALLPAFAPIVLVLFVIYGAWGARLSNYLPVAWNDAIGYWLWIRQFSHFGLGGGYNFPNELMPPAAFNHFGEGSPIYIYVYGIFGYLLGWSPHQPILVNFGLIIASVYIFSRLMRLDTAQNLMLALVMAVSWPVMIFAATTSHESLNQVIGIVFAGIFLCLRQSERIHPVAGVSILFFAFFAGMLRLSWVILFLPLFFYLFPGSVIRRMLASLLLSGILIIGIVSLTQLLVPPINNSIFAALDNEHGILSGLQMQFIAQIKKLVLLQRFVPGIAIIFLLAMLLVYGFRESLSLLRKEMRFDDLMKSQAFFDIYNVLALLMAGMTLYLANGFYRVFFAPLLVSVFMHITQRSYRFIWSLVLFSILFAPVMLTGQKDWDGAKMNYTYRMTELTDSQSELDRLVTFDDKTDNPWCNTILIPLIYYDSRLTGLRPGIGVSYIRSHPLPNVPLQSKYLLLREEDYTVLVEKNALRSEPLASLPIGNLYRNLDANCTP